MPKLRLNLLGNFQAFLDGVPVGGSDGAAANTAWRAWLQNAATNQRLGIACLEKLFVFLMNETENTLPEER